MTDDAGFENRSGMSLLNLEVHSHDILLVGKIRKAYLQDDFKNTLPARIVVFFSWHWQGEGKAQHGDVGATSLRPNLSKKSHI